MNLTVTMKYCPSCKRRRNITQFDLHKKCRMCRGLKKPIHIAHSVLGIEKLLEPKDTQLTSS